jgi:hypothetical protein
LPRCHGSRLLSLRSLCFHSPAVAFLPPPALERLSRALPQPRCLPAPHPPFVPPFSVFTWADHPFQGNRQSRAGVLIHSSDRYPLGNCDWPGLETFPDYLTRLGTVSCLASLTAQLLLRVTDDARTPPEELVNPASAPDFYLQLTEGPRQPACLDLSPVAWAYPRNFGASPQSYFTCIPYYRVYVKWFKHTL